MGLSDRTDDNNGQPLGEGYITLSTSAGNVLRFQSPASANQYRLSNPSQFDPIGKGEYNKINQNPA